MRVYQSSPSTSLSIPEALKDQGAVIVQYLGADNFAGGKQGAEMVLKDLGADASLKIGFVTEPDEVPTVVRIKVLRKSSQRIPMPR